MKIYPVHYFSRQLIVALVAVLAVTLMACSPKSPAVTSPTKTQSAAVKLVFITQPAGAEAGAVLATQPVVAIEDINGNVVTGSSKVVTMTITGSTPGPYGDLYGGTTLTAVNGIFNFKELSIDKAGRFTLTAESSGLTPAVSEPFEITPVAGAKLVFTKDVVGASAGAAFAVLPQVKVLDMYGNLAVSSTAKVILTLEIVTKESYDAVITGEAVGQAQNGIVDFKGVSIERVGSYALVASAGGLTSATSNVFSITSGIAAKLFFNTQPLTTTPGAELTVMPPTIAVVVQDKFGNTVSGSSAEVTITITPDTGAGGAVLSGVTKLKANNGVANFGGLSIDRVGSGYTLTATSSGLTSAVSDPFDITPSVSSGASSNTTTP
jgi:hypothetical protein